METTMATRRLCWLVLACAGPLGCSLLQPSGRRSYPSVLSPVKAPATKPAPSAATGQARVSLDKATFDELMTILPHLEPKDRAELLAQMKDIDPALAPAVLRQFRGALAAKAKPPSATSDTARASRGRPAPSAPTAGPAAPGAAAVRGRRVKDMRVASARPGPGLRDALESVSKGVRGASSPKAPSAATPRPVRPAAASADRDLPLVRFGAVGVASDKPAVRANASACLKPEPDKARETPAQEWARLVKRLQEAATRRSDGNPSDVRPRVVLSLLHWMDRQQGPAIKALDKLPEDESALFREVVLTLFAYFDKEHAVDASDQATRALDHLEPAVHRLRRRAELRLAALEFCRRVTSYGAYVPFAKREFSIRQRVLVYCAVDNFATQQNPDGRHRTLMSSVLTIYDSAGHRVWSKEFPDTEDCSNVPRRDYFHTYDFRLPLGIKPGTYTLMASVQDKVASKVAEKRVTFTIR